MKINTVMKIVGRSIAEKKDGQLSGRIMLETKHGDLFRVDCSPDLSDTAEVGADATLTIEQI